MPSPWHRHRATAPQGLAAETGSPPASGCSRSRRSPDATTAMRGSRVDPPLYPMEYIDLDGAKTSSERPPIPGGNMVKTLAFAPPAQEPMSLAKALALVD